MTTPHRIVNVPGLPPPRGYSDAVVAAPGRLVHIAGQVAQDAKGNIQGTTFSEQFDLAAANVVQALRAAGGLPEHLVSMTAYVTDRDAYLAARSQLAVVWQSHFDNHYPAFAVIGTTGLIDPRAMVELVAVAVVP